MVVFLVCMVCGSGFIKIWLKDGKYTSKLCLFRRLTKSGRY